MEQKLWEKCVEFHGHECPGLAIGYRAFEVAKEKLGLTFSEDEEIVCVTENDACGVDAVQVLSGCTFGKGNLIYNGTGKMAFSFYNRSNDKSVRIIMKPIKNGMERPKMQEFILTGNVEEVFDVKATTFILPEKARLFTSVICEECGEPSPEHKMRLNDGKKVCRDCFNEYSRGF